MSTLGKVLLFLNLLAAVGLVYLTAQDWTKRQEITAVVLRYQLTLQGLPTDPVKADGDSKDDDTVPVEIKTAAGTTATNVRKKIIETYFSGASGGDTFGGSTVLSLVDELKRADSKLQTAIEAQQGDAGKLAYLVGANQPGKGFVPGLLMTMAESYDERAAIKALAYPTPQGEQLKTNLDAARARLKVKYEALTGPPSPNKATEVATRMTELKDKIVKNPNDEAAKKELAAISAAGAPDFTRSDADRRRRITQFLLCLDPSGAWQKRVMTVVGLRTYHAALNEQAGRLADIARQTERMIEADQATFESEYDLLKKMAVRADILVNEEDRLVKGLIEMEALDASGLAARKTQLQNLQTELARLQAEIATVLKAQAETEKTVFALQRKVGDTLKGNLDLETKLGQSEQPKP